MKRFLVTLCASVALFVWANMTLAQSWIPYIMGPSQQVLIVKNFISLSGNEKKVRYGHRNELHRLSRASCGKREGG
jgi:hypothetical protein